MGRGKWFDADGTKRGEWTEDEDQKLVAYIEEYGIGDWRFLPEKAGLRRCGKSCRLRWLNYLRPGVKKGKFTPQEEEAIINFHSVLGNRFITYFHVNFAKNICLLIIFKDIITILVYHVKSVQPNKGSVYICHKRVSGYQQVSRALLMYPNPRLRWAAIAQQMPNRSDNDIKNHWNSCLKKRLQRNGIDPKTHQPIINKLTVKTTSFDKECGNSSSSPASSSSSSSFGSAYILNKIATGISSRQNDVDDRIKNILSDPRITSFNGEEDKCEELKKDHEKIMAGGDQEDGFLMWDEEKVRRFMEETGLMESEQRSYDGVYNSSLDFSSPHSPSSGVYETGLLEDHLFS